MYWYYKLILGLILLSLLGGGLYLVRDSIELPDFFASQPQDPVKPGTQNPQSNNGKGTGQGQTPTVPKGDQGTQNVTLPPVDNRDLTPESRILLRVLKSAQRLLDENKLEDAHTAAQKVLKHDDCVPYSRLPANPG